LPTHAGVRPLLRELNAGNSIGLAMDTRLDTGEPLPFFCVDALTNTSAARLALRSGAALIPIRGERLRPGHFRVSVMAPIASPVPDAKLAEQATAMTRQINEHFEEWIRAAPDHWMCRSYADRKLALNLPHRVASQDLCPIAAHLISLARRWLLEANTPWYGSG